MEYGVASLLNLDVYFLFFSLKLVKLTMNRHTVYLWLKNAMKEKKQLRNSNDNTEGGEFNAYSCIPLCFIINFPNTKNNTCEGG